METELQVSDEATGRSLPCPTRAAGPESGFGLVEVLIAVVILAFGLLALAGVSLSTASQTRGAAYDTDHAMAAQEILDAMAQNYSGVAVGSSDTTVSVAGISYSVARTVTQPSAKLKSVQLIVSGGAGAAPDTFVTRLHEPMTLP
jgi:Tfp pilus assembly protein PilV